MNAFATSVSIGLQYGVPLETFVRKFSHMRFEPEGITRNPEIPFAKSLPDYIMRWLGSRFIEDTTRSRSSASSPRRSAPSARPAGAADRRHGVALDRQRAFNGQRPLERRGQRQRRRQGPDQSADRHAARRPGQDGRARLGPACEQCGG